MPPFDITEILKILMQGQGGQFPPPLQAGQLGRSQTPAPTIPASQHMPGSTNPGMGMPPRSMGPPSALPASLGPSMMSAMPTAGTLPPPSPSYKFNYGSTNIDSQPPPVSRPPGLDAPPPGSGSPMHRGPMDIGPQALGAQTSQIRGPGHMSPGIYGSSVPTQIAPTAISPTRNLGGAVPQGFMPPSPIPPGGSNFSMNPSSLARMDPGQRAAIPRMPPPMPGPPAGSLNSALGVGQGLGQPGSPPSTGLPASARMGPGPGAPSMMGSLGSAAKGLIPGALGSIGGSLMAGQGQDLSNSLGLGKMPLGAAGQVEPQQVLMELLAQLLQGAGRGINMDMPQGPSPMDWERAKANRGYGL